MDEFILQSDERIKIFKLLCENKSLTFNEIVKHTQIHSNKLSYQLNLMKEKEFVAVNEGNYSLTTHAQRLIPYFSQILKKEVGVLPVVLGIVLKDDKILLIKRKKMPYKDHWGLFGGKQLVSETIQETIEREVFEEAAIKTKFKKCNAIVHEQLKENGEYKHAFLLIITTLQALEEKAMEQQEGQVKWFSLADTLAGKVEQMIPSDLEFLIKFAKKKTTITHFIVDESQEKFKVSKS